MPDQPGKFNFDADIKAALEKKNGTVPPTTADESGTVPGSNYLRLIAATGLRAGLPMLGQLGGALVPLPGAAEAAGAIGGGLGEYLAEKVEPNNPTHLTHNGRIAVAAGLGAVPLSWIGAVGRPLLGLLKGGALSTAGIAGNKLASGTPLTEWSGNDLINVGLGAGIGGAFGMLGGPKGPTSPTPAQPVIDPAAIELNTPSGLRIAADKLSKLPVGADVTPGVKAAHAAVADAIERNPTGPLAKQVIGPKGVPPTPSINEMDNLIEQGFADASKLTPAQKQAYAESITDQSMLAKAQKYAADAPKRAAAAQKLIADAKKTADLAAQQAEINARKAAPGVVPTKGPVIENITGVGENGEKASSKTTYAPKDESATPPVDGAGNPVTPLAPHEQNYFTKGDALRAAKAANQAAAEKGMPPPYDPKNWNVVEVPGGGARIAQKGEGRSVASPALVKALEAEEGATPAPNSAKQPSTSLNKTLNPEPVDKGVPSEVQVGSVPPNPTVPSEGAPTANPNTNPNAAALAELEAEIKTNALLRTGGGTGPLPETPPIPPTPGPISRAEFGAINGEQPSPVESPTPVPPTEPSATPVDESTAPPPPAPPITESPNPLPGVGKAGQPIIPFKSAKDAAGAGFGAILDARRAGDVVPDEAIGTASKGFNRVKMESPMTAEDAAATLSNKRSLGTFIAAVKRGLASGDLPAAPAMDAVRPDITGPNGEQVPEPPPEPTEDKGTTLSAFGGGQGSAIRQAIRNNPMLAARLGLGTVGAGLGAANDKNDPLRGAIIGGGIGAALPSAGKAIGNIDWTGLAKRLPDIERFGYLAAPNSAAANIVGAPIGLGATTGIEKYLEGMASGNATERQQAVDLLKLLPTLPSRWRGAMREAGQMLTDSPENIGEMHADQTGSGAKYWTNRILAGPAQMTTAGHLGLRDAAIEAGYPKAEATEFALGNDPGIGSGSKLIRAFGKGRQNAKATQLEDGTKNYIEALAAPFTRTASNVAAATPTRTPGLGLLLKAAGKTEESWPAIVAQQGLGTAISGTAYLAGENTDPANAPAIRKWVRNMGGRYGMVATVAFEMGQAARQNKSKAAAFGKGIISGVPMPTTEPLQDLINAATSFSGGQPELPGAFVPQAVKPLIPSEFLTKRGR